MKKFAALGLFTFQFFVLSLLSVPAQAAIKVFATVPEWAALAQEIGGDKVSVVSATTGLQDPHRIDAKPSLIAKARSAQLVVATGAELEIGWLPVVLRDSGNPDIQPGHLGYFEAASVITMLDVPKVIDRAHGDVHAAGNPHIQTDPRNVLKVAVALSARMAEIDPAEAASYRSALQAFTAKWQAALARWEKEALPLKGVPVLVQHNAFPYMIRWLGLREVATLEPKPGVEPSASYLSGIVARLATEPARMVLRPAYQNDAPSRWVSDAAKIPAVVLPFTIGGTPTATDLVGLFDDTVHRLLAAAAAK